MKKIIRMIGIGIETALLFIVIGGITSGVSKYVYSDILIENFKKRGVFDETSSSYLKRIYVIESNETRPTVFKEGIDYYPGDTADILITLKSELDIPFVHDFISFFAGGHAAIVLGDYTDAIDMVSNKNTVESSGLNEDFNLADTYTKEYWHDYPYPVIGLRVDLTEEQRNLVVAKTMAMVFEPYNFSFLFDTKNKSYCSDLVSKIYSSIGINLNKDGFTTSIYDLLISDQTYISYYRYFDSNGIEYIYYLDSK